MGFLIAIVLPPIFNIFYTPYRGAHRAAHPAGDHVQLLLSEALIKARLVEVSLRNRKSYIGFVSESGVGDGDTDVILLPLSSGFRDKYTHKLTITTDYEPILKEYVDNKKHNLSYIDFRVVIPIAEIISARFFFPAVYNQFQEEPFQEEHDKNNLDVEKV